MGESYMKKYLWIVLVVLLAVCRISGSVFAGPGATLEVTALDDTQHEYELKPGETATGRLLAVCSGSTMTEYAWTSSDPEVVSVAADVPSNYGNLTILKAGKATITVKVTPFGEAELSADFDITVTEPEPATLTITPIGDTKNTYELKPGETATGQLFASTNVLTIEDYVWESSNSEVVSVEIDPQLGSSSANITVKKAGKATITVEVTIEGGDVLSADFDITVTEDITDPESESVVVYALPEDEYGAYVINEVSGEKEYLLFHTYAICMQFLGREDLCSDYTRNYHK